MKGRIIPITEEAQQAKVDEYNKDKRGPLTKMPVVPRNAETGWPLLQVSAFSAIGGARYEPVLGGMKCHEFPIAHFFLASLLIHVEGRKSVLDIKDAELPLEQFTLNNLYGDAHLLDGFTFQHRHGAIIISTQTGAFGKTTTVTVQGEDEKLSKILNQLLAA